MDADDTNSFQLSGSNVIKWYNKAGSDYAFDQKTGDPTRTVVNGKNVVNFDGNDQLWTDNSFIASNYSILSVSRLTGGQNARVIASKDKNWLMGFHGGKNNRFYFEGWVLQANEAVDTNWHLHALTMNNSDQANTWTNAVQSTTNGTGAHNSNYSPGKLSLGAQTNLNQASKGEVAELLVFDRVISTSDRQKLERYLALKWGLTLPSSVPGWQNGYTLSGCTKCGRYCSLHERAICEYQLCLPDCGNQLQGHSMVGCLLRAHQLPGPSTCNFCRCRHFRGGHHRHHQWYSAIVRW